MTAKTERPNPRHVSLAQMILDIALERGIEPGERLAEQALASMCNVSRTPIRKALKLLADNDLVTADADGGFVLTADPSSTPRLDEAVRVSNDQQINSSILRDLTAGRISATQTVASLQRRYGVSRQAIQNGLTKLAEQNLAERASGQQWLLNQFAVSRDAVAKSYEFRLATEPLALTLPDFHRDLTALASLRQMMQTLRGMNETAFDRTMFERTDFEFHMMVAKGCGNPFMVEALTNHHRMRRETHGGSKVGTFRLMQSNIDHIQILEQIETGRMELAADLMRVHIQMSQSHRPKLAGRGVPPTFKIA